MLLMLTDRVNTRSERGVNRHSCQVIRTSARLQEKFCDICGSQFGISDLTLCVNTIDTFHGSIIQPFSNRSNKKPTNM